jgi:hypothetical protein
MTQGKMKARAYKMKSDKIEFGNIGLEKNMSKLRAALIKKASSASGMPHIFMRLMPVYAIIFVVAAAAYYMRIDYNYTNSSVNELGGVWCTYNDSWQGGNSVVWPPASKNGENSFVKSSPGCTGKGYAVRITGTAGTKLGDDYIGVTTFLSPHSTCPECVGIDLSKFSGIEFMIKGSVTAGNVIFMLPHESRRIDASRGICRSLTSYADYGADITKYITPRWKKVKIDFRKDLRQPAGTKPEYLVSIEDVLSDANIIKWQYMNGNGRRVDIWIDRLEFY